MNKPLLILFAFLIICLAKTHAQQRISIYACGFTIHSNGDPNAELMPLKLDKNGKYLINYGAVFHYKRYINERVTINAIQTIQADCALQKSAGSGFTIGYEFFNRENHCFTIATGPGFYIRESWQKFDNYIEETNFWLTKNEKLEYMIYPLVPYLEYNYTPESSNLGIGSYLIFDPFGRLYNIGVGMSYTFGSKE